MLVNIANHVAVHQLLALLEGVGQALLADAVYNPRNARRDAEYLVYGFVCEAVIALRHGETRVAADRSVHDADRARHGQRLGEGTALLLIRQEKVQPEAGNQAALFFASPMFLRE